LLDVLDEDPERRRGRAAVAEEPDGEMEVDVSAAAETSASEGEYPRRSCSRHHRRTGSSSAIFSASTAAIMGGILPGPKDQRDAAVP
jgi:hypothetical protein